MSQLVTIESILVIAANFLFYFIIAISGAFIKDLYDNFVNGKKRIEFTRVFIASISTAFICIGLQEYLSARFSLNIIILFSFLCGVVGFEIFGCINSLKGLKTSVLEIIRIKRVIDSGDIGEIEKVIKEKQAKVKKEEVDENGSEPEPDTNKDTSQNETKEIDDLLQEVIDSNSR